MSCRNQKYSLWAGAILPNLAATWKKKQTKEGPFAHLFFTRHFHFSLQRHFGAGQEGKIKASERWICRQTITCWHHWQCISWGEGSNLTIPDNQQLDQRYGLVQEKILQSDNSAKILYIPAFDNIFCMITKCKIISIFISILPHE